MTDILLTGSLTFDCHIMHYIIVRIFLPRSSNLAQDSKEDLILVWAFQTGRQIEWVHLVRYQMHKALRANAPLPYPHLVTLFLHHFNVPLDDEPFVKVKRYFSLVLVWLPSLVTERMLMVNGFANMTCLRLFLTSVPHLLHHNGVIPLLF